MENQLQEIGLTEQESKVYLQLLKEKYQEASKISKLTKINRSVTYSVLNSLIQKGLTSYVIRNNIKYFIAADPKTLIDFLKDKEKILQNILPKLSNIIPTEKENISVELYQGTKGGITVLKDIIRTGKDYVVLGEDGTFNQFIYAKQFLRQLKEKKIKERILAKEGTKILKTKKSEVRYLPKEFQIPTITTIYGNKIAIAIFTEPFYTILIKSKDLADSYRSFFEILWKISKKQ
ncbi:MAG: helix-turn-helix domain-containing protein [Nanoarchaeota archaeon]|nr:hypothetical protein [Nanoarchaeota archaeon]MBU1445619.1 hypothetical protein [Nanoarchaeota archaeon]MBU2406919.1 hypothetical protein [Nanoarchaeota archaeon]MBU2420811.1 hypothetical protein [Nanoarchaeota archaeon]MBU2475646.1 hypothetical protein [Nanoarchaeota archaeon]